MNVRNMDSSLNSKSESATLIGGRNLKIRTFLPSSPFHKGGLRGIFSVGSAAYYDRLKFFEYLIAEFIQEKV